MKITLKDLLKKEVEETNAPVEMGGILSALQKALTEANNNAIKDFRAKVEEEKKNALEELRRKTEEAEAYVKSLKPDKGEPGKDYILTPADKKQIAASVKVPIVEKVIERTEVVKEQPIVTVKEVALKDTGAEIIEKVSHEEIYQKLNSAPLNPKTMLDWSHIKNAPSTKQAKRVGGGGDIIYQYDLSSSLNGSTKTFTVPYHRKITAVLSSSTPFIFRETTDYTDTATTITFDASVDASIMLAAGQSLVFLYVV